LLTAKKKTYLWSILTSQILFIFLLPVFLHLFQYLHSIVIVVVWAVLTAFVSFIVFYIRKEKMVICHTLFYLMTIVYGMCLLVLLFFRPSNQTYDKYNLIPFETILYYLKGDVSPFIAFYNLSANVGLFIPFGFLLFIMKLKKWKKILYPISSVVLVELSQFLMHRGSLDVDDLILNLFGIYLGYIISPLILKVITFR